jgi:hypothetical protein
MTICFRHNIYLLESAKVQNFSGYAKLFKNPGERQIQEPDATCLKEELLDVSKLSNFLGLRLILCWKIYYIHISSISYLCSRVNCFFIFHSNGQIQLPNATFLKTFRAGGLLPCPARTTLD